METERTLAAEMLLEKLSSEAYHDGLSAELIRSDPEIQRMITSEYERLQDTIQLLAAENRCSRAALAALGSILQNKTSEGFPAVRLHGGSEVVDEVESLAIQRAKRVFGAKYANVQPHSGTTANQIVITALLEPGDGILSMSPGHGGHFSHGSMDSITARFFRIENYYVDRESFLLDYDQIAEQARDFKPKLIICGASAYPRAIDFVRFRQIADEVGAMLLADISHISALVIAGVHPSPIDCAHVTTTSTYKPGGPRGGLILMGRHHDLKIRTRSGDNMLRQLIEKATFPGLQGTPCFNNIAAKAVFFKEAESKQYKARQFRVVENAKRLAANLMQKGYNVLTGGTDNHLMLVNVAGISEGLTGFAAQKCLEDCGIVVDRIHLPYDDKPNITTGIRLGTPIVTRNGMGVPEMDQIADMMDAVLKKIQLVSECQYAIDESFATNAKQQAKMLSRRFPFQ